MKNYFCALITILTMNCAFAHAYSPAAGALSNNGTAETYYELLASKFATGVRPDPAKLIKNLWSGRCFINTSPNDPVNSAFAFKLATSGDVGPIANDVSPRYKAVSVWKLSAPADYFDHQTLQSVDLRSFGLFDVVIDGTEVSYQNLNGGKTRLRLNGKYLIEETSNSSETWLYCYYFIPEYPL